MAAEQTAAELTTRDVLFQVDRRLTLIEGDLRSLADKVDGLDDKLDANLKWTIGTLVVLIGLVIAVIKL